MPCLRSPLCQVQYWPVFNCLASCHKDAAYCPVTRNEKEGSEPRNRHNGRCEDGFPSGDHRNLTASVHTLLVRCQDGASSAKSGASQGRPVLTLEVPLKEDSFVVTPWSYFRNSVRFSHSNMYQCSSHVVGVCRSRLWNRRHQSHAGMRNRALLCTRSCDALVMSKRCDSLMSRSSRSL